MTGSEVVYRCDGCGAEFRVVSERRPRVVCPECKVVAIPSGDREALRAYQVGYVRYQEARRQIGAGLKRYAGQRLVDARALFDGASEDFEVAVDEFRDATNKADTAHVEERADAAREKATCFWQGADWLSGATYAQEDDDVERATHFREEAEAKLVEARDIGTVDSPEELGRHTDAEVPTEADSELGHRDNSTETPDGQSADPESPDVPSAESRPASDEPHRADPT